MNGQNKTGNNDPADATHRQDADGSHSLELAQRVEEYLAKLEKGEAPDRAQWIAAHPHLAPHLEEALAGLDWMRRLSGDKAAEPAPAQLGDFRILREIGRGGMGVVYEAEQVSLKRRVALKVLRLGPVIDKVAMQRFQREAETVGRLHHTNIVPIFAIGAEDGVRYYAMQFIEGRDLGKVALEMRNGSSSVDFRQIADWGLQAAEALAHAHQRHVIHRDIKPSNLILDPDGRIWLTDFGLARRTDDVSLSLTGALLGTPRYMSPEQAAAAHRPIDHRTDLYSLGATLYELVTGRPIFEGASAHEVLAQILHTEPKPPRIIAPTLPRDFETLILQCLAKDPDQRYASAQTLADDLRSLVAGRPISARRPSWFERTRRWVRQHQRPLALASLLVSTAILAALGGRHLWRSYAESRLARLQFGSSNPGAVAEILDAEGNAIVPRIPVPHELPVTLASGSYFVRLSAPGILSETCPLEVPPRARIRHDLSLNPQWLWEPRELAVPQAMEWVPLGDRSGILLFLPPQRSPGSPDLPARLRLIDGESAKPVWTQDLNLDASTQPEGDLAEWQSLISHWAVAPNFAGTRIGERITDLDRDGAGDFILVSRHSASLLAVSGASGRVLWWHRSHSATSPEVPNGIRWHPQPGQSFAVSYPEVADLDNDGIDDVVSAFRSNVETYSHPSGQPVHVPGRSWIAAVSGRTGLEMWRHRVDADWSDYVSSSTGARWDALAHPRILRLRDRLSVLFVDTAGFRVLDAATGSATTQPMALGFGIDRAPLWIPSRDGAGGLAVVLRRFVETDAHLELVGVDPNEGAVRWRQTAITVLGGVASELDAIPLEVFQAVDLEDDRTMELATPMSRHPRPDRWTFGVQVMDAATGKVRWETILHDAEHPQSILSETRLIPGPDLNRDGHRDLWVTLHAYDARTQRHGMLAAALSGADGTVLWKRHLPGIAGIRTLAWWQADSEGWPMLVAATRLSGNERESILFLSARTGQISHRLSDVREFHIADFNGDGAPDFFHALRQQNTLRWAAIRGQPRPVRQWLGTRIPGPDANGDGALDFYSLAGSTLAAHSGLDGRALWTIEADFALPEALWPPPTSNAHATRDSEAPLIAKVQPRKSPPVSSGPPAPTLAAFSHRNGRRLWTADALQLGHGSRGGTRYGWAFEYPRLEFADLDGDAHPEILVSHVTDANDVRLSVLSGATGQRLWEVPLIDGAQAPDPRPAGAPLADFTGDGIADLAAILPPTPHGNGQPVASYTVNVLHGKDGRPLWKSPFTLAQDPGQILWPEPVLGDLDDDGMPEVIVVRHRGLHANRGYDCELVTLDGRDGRVRWTWAWEAGFPAVWSPLFLRSHDPKLRRIALGLTVLRPQPGIDAIGGFGFVQLDPSGQLLAHQEVQLIDQPPSQAGLAWGALDLDRDGTDELVFPDGDSLCAGFGSGNTVLWRKSLAHPDVGGFRALFPGKSSSSTTDTLVLWSGREVQGIEGRNGAVVWRGRAPGNPVWGNQDFPHLTTVRLSGSHSAVSLLFHAPISRNGVTTLEGTWPTSADGRYTVSAESPKL